MLWNVPSTSAPAMRLPTMAARRSRITGGLVGEGHRDDALGPDAEQTGG
ncbi:MAG: hypothetical protein U0168_25385 [Nannocystaceae bacterium]